MALRRTALIERVLRDRTPQSPAAAATRQLCRPRVWNDIHCFEMDNLAEVHRKLANIEEEIWGKIVVMERNARSAKAYLRSRSVAVDGSHSEFDGFRIGVSRFVNEYRDEGSAKAIRRFGKGVRIRIDDSGALWVKCADGTAVFVKGMLGEFTVHSNPVKVFDLREFKDLVVMNVNRDDAAKCAITYLQVEEHCEMLSAPLWFAIIHLIALDMIQTLNAHSSSESGTSMSSCLSQRFEDSAYSTPRIEEPNGLRSPSPYATSTASHLNKLHRGGAFKRITRAEQLSYSSTRSARTPSDLSGKRNVGRSLLDLSDLDRIRNPAYFVFDRGDRRDRRHRCGVPTPFLPEYQRKMAARFKRSRSETALYSDKL